MINIINKQDCSGCHACYSVCPKQCISMIADNEGFLYPSVDKEHCINCGLCERVCPIITPKTSNKSENDIVAYGAYSKNENMRMQSTSGGAFTEIAEYVIKNNGVVFGASFNDDFSVSHKSASTIEEIAKFRGSKYVQSTIGNTYKEARELLQNGKLVLFTGTPCQIDGLYSYLNKEYENLITQDIVCHGVPSPMVWKKYREYQSNVNKSQISSVSFRSKASGWKSYSIVLGFENGAEYKQRAINDPYIKSFLKNLCLRPSCYDCKFKTKARRSDITLADFWGIQNIMPQMDDDKGTSLILVNSQKGKDLLDSVSEGFVLENTDLDGALKYNSSAVKASQAPKERDEFISAVEEQGFLIASKKYLKNDSFSVRLKRKIKRIIGKFKR